MSEYSQNWSKAVVNANVKQGIPLTLNQMVTYELVKSGPNKGMWAIKEGSRIVGYQENSPYA